MRSIAVDWLSSYIGRGAAALLVPGWFACMAAAWLAVSLLTLRAATRRGDDVPALASVLALVYAAAIVGGIALPAIVAAARALWAGHGFRLRWAGMVSYAGFACGAVALVVALRRSAALPPARAADLLAAPLGVGLCIARLGCFLAGCDYGQVSSLPWAVRFPAGSAAWRDHVRAGWISPERGASLPVHPTQLYESLLGLVLCAAALLVARTTWTRRSSGRVFAVVAAGYALGRVAIENVRGDLGRGLFGPWSSAQLVFTSVLAALAVLLWRDRRKLATAATSAAVALLVNAGTAHAGYPPVPVTTAPAPSASAAPATPAGHRVPAPPTAAPPTATPPPSAGAAPAAPAGPAPSAAPGATPVVTVPPPPAASVRRPVYRLGAQLVGASAMNRRDRQVPPLGGASLTAGVQFDVFGIEIDLTSIASAVATHQSASVALALGGPIGERLFAAGRFGLGVNLVNFEDRAFEDVGSGDLRIGSELGIALSPRWSLVLRPIEIDVIGARALGGPIWSYQLQLGFAYRFAPSPAPAHAAPARAAPAHAAPARTAPALASPTTTRAPQ